MWRTCMAKSVALMIATLLSLPGINGQQPPSAPKNTTTFGAAATRRKLTAEQEHGLRLLKTAESQAGGLQADMRAFVLWQAARAYTGFDPSKAGGLMRQAFEVTLSIENPVD